MISWQRTLMLFISNYFQLSMQYWQNKKNLWFQVHVLYKDSISNIIHRLIFNLNSRWKGGKVRSFIIWPQNKMALKPKVRILVHKIVVYFLLLFLMVNEVYKIVCAEQSCCACFLETGCMWEFKFSRQISLVHMLWN
jgi:hypothetical protein